MANNPYKVRLDSYNQGRSSNAVQSVVFDVMPTISQSHQVEYQAFDPVHSPSSYYVYRGTKAVTFELGCKFISRTTQEATNNLGYLNILRGWTRGYFGFGTSNSGNTATRDIFTNSYLKSSGGPVTSQVLQPLSRSDLNNIISTNGFGNGVGPTTNIPSIASTVQQASNTATQAATKALSDSQLTQYAKAYLDNMNQNQLNANNIVRVQTPAGTETYSQGQEMLGAPPEVLKLSAYSNATNENGILNKMSNISSVPVVILSLSYTYADDVDYIPTIQGQPFPIVMNLSISLAESHSPQELEYFDIYKYRAGQLPGF